MLPLFASAQRLKIAQGDFEVAGSAVFDSSQIGAKMRFGTFAANYFQLGGEFEWLDTDYATRTGIGMYFIRLYETNAYLLPYFGVGLGLGTLEYDDSSDESGMELSFLLGLKYFLSDNVSLNTEFSFGMSSADTYMGSDEPDSTQASVRIGLSYFW
jgi:opacity protein-like surface antigen